MRSVLTNLELARGGVEVHQFSPEIVDAIGLPPDTLADPAAFEGALGVSRLALNLLSGDSSEMGVRIRFVTDLNPDHEKSVLTCSGLSKMLCYVKQPGQKHPFVLYERQWMQGNRSGWFGQSTLGVTLGRDELRKSRTDIEKHMVLLDNLKQYARPTARIQHLQEQIDALQRELSMRPQPILSLGNFAIVRSK